MAGRVIHLSEEVHSKVKAHCERFGIAMSEFAGRALLVAIEKGPLKAVPVRRKLKPLQITDDRTLEQKEKDGDLQPWELPPFWQGRGHGRERDRSLEGGAEGE